MTHQAPSWPLSVSGRLSASLLCATLLVSLPANAQPGGVMQGFPPAPEQRVTKTNAFVPPYLRWSASHAREVSPTRDILRADTPLTLPAGAALRLDQLSIKVGADAFTLEHYLRETATDGLIVVHQGKVVYEYYDQDFSARQPHIWASMTKSVTGLLASQFIVEGKLDPAAKLVQYVPELAGTPFGESTVEQNLNMEVPVAYPEGIPPDLGLFAATGLIPRAPGMPTDIYAFLKVAQIAEPASQTPLFFYQNGSPEAVAWALRRISGQTWSELVSQRIWSRFALDNAYVQVDELGTEMASGGISTSLRDTARFAELVRREAAQPAGDDSFRKAVHSLFEPADNQALFAKGNLASGRAGYGYRHYWYQKNDGDDSLEASGRFGQKIYINPKREVVIVKLSATPDQARRATSAAGGPNVSARSIDSHGAFNEMVSAVLNALPH